MLGSTERTSMAIHQTKKQSDLEKRLQLLRRQVYGQESVASSKYYVAREDKKNSLTSSFQLPATDISYLHQDLLKILIFSLFAIGAQVILFFLSKNHILNLNLF
ncbi:hypothetical protein HYU95_01315 [Candidatus Daviesbacteria bacterium]|nr:hypothetical protein [Candidatus Daviesbacteria bacterium]